MENPLELHPNHYRQNVLIESLCGEWNSASIESRAQLEALRLQNLGRILWPIFIIRIGSKHLTPNP